MMKKGFTLAEVLITLAIIGVVATLTLPALMTNTSEAQYVTGLKKGINTLAEAGQMSESLAGYTYGSFTVKTAPDNKDIDENRQSLFDMLNTRAKVDISKSGLANSDIIKGLYSGGAMIDKAGNNYVIFFQDGSALSYPFGSTDGTSFDALLDVNGNKGPNQISNCSQNRNIVSSDAKNTGDDEACTTKANRVVKDQFKLHFENGTVRPGTAIGRWAMSN